MGGAGGEGILVALSWMYFQNGEKDAYIRQNNDKYNDNNDALWRDFLNHFRRRVLRTRKLWKWWIVIEYTVNFIWSTKGQIEAITSKYLRFSIHLGRRLNPLEGFRLYRISVRTRAEVSECHFRTEVSHTVSHRDNYFFPEKALQDDSCDRWGVPYKSQMVEEKVQGHVKLRAASAQHNYAHIVHEGERIDC